MLSLCWCFKTAKPISVRVPLALALVFLLWPKHVWIQKHHRCALANALQCMGWKSLYSVKQSECHATMQCLADEKKSSGFQISSFNQSFFRQLINGSWTFSSPSSETSKSQTLWSLLTPLQSMGDSNASDMKPQESLEVFQFWSRKVSFWLNHKNTRISNGCQRWCLFAQRVFVGLSKAMDREWHIQGADGLPNAKFSLRRFREIRRSWIRKRSSFTCCENCPMAIATPLNVTKSSPETIVNFEPQNCLTFWLCSSTMQLQKSWFVSPWPTPELLYRCETSCACLPLSQPNLLQPLQQP